MSKIPGLILKFPSFKPSIYEDATKMTKYSWAHPAVFPQPLDCVQELKESKDIIK